MKVNEILSQANNDFKNVQEIQDQLFDVKKVRLRTGIKGFESPENYGVYKTTGGTALGVVGKIYEPMQPREMLDAVCQSILETDNPGLDLSTLTYKSFKEDKRISFRLKAGNIKFTNVLGREDETEVYLDFQTSFDGGLKTCVGLWTHRLVCSNGMKAWKKEYGFHTKHTVKQNAKALSSVKSVLKALEGVTELEELFTTLDSVEVTDKEINEFVKKVTGYDVKEKDEMNKRSKDIYDKIHESLQIEFARTGKTAFGLLQGITHYHNHQVEKDNMDDYLMYDTGAYFNNKAQKAVIEMFVN